MIVMIRWIIARLTFLVVLSTGSLMSQVFTPITTGDAVSVVNASRSVTWVDYDNDGYLDLFLTNGPSRGQNNELYRNNGPPDFLLVRVTESPVVSDSGRSDGCTWGDVDNDGDIDLFVVNWYNDNNLLYLNNGAGGFSQVLSGDPVLDGGLSETATWGDYDNDGFLDLIVTNSGDRGVARRNFLYHSNHGGLTGVTGNPVSDDVEFSRGATWIDYDNDGDLDLFVANEEDQNNSLYKNLLREEGVARFAKFSSGPLVSDGGSSWSASWGDYNNDGFEDAFVANWMGENDFLYANAGNGIFTRVLNDTIVHDGAYSASSCWGDYDNDGDLDMIVTAAYKKGEKLTNLLYQNMLMETGRTGFARCDAGAVTADSGYSYGAAWGDYDNDGDLDLFVARTFAEAQKNAFYRNEGTGNHWLGIRCEGTNGNRAAIGATVRAKAEIAGKEVWQMRRVSGQNGYCNQNLVLNFGLGNATVVDSLVVTWPTGIRTMHRNIPADRYVRLREDGSLKVWEDAH
jgi:hypothetical protein